MKNTNKLFITILISLLLVVMAPIVLAVPSDFTLSISESYNITGGSSLVTNKESVYLSWTTSTGEGDMKYQVYRINDDSSSTTLGDPVGSESYNIILDESYIDGDYTFQVNAIDTDGTTTSSNPVTLVIDREPTSAVDSLKITDGVNDIQNQKSNTKNVYLSWNAPTDSVGYKLYYKVDDSTPTDITDFADVSITGTEANIDISDNDLDTGLNLLNGLITFQVTSLDNAGNESPTSEVSFTYDTKAPRSVNNVVMRKNNASGSIIQRDGLTNSNLIYVSWSSPIGETVSKYLVYVKQDDGSFELESESNVTNITINTEGIPDGRLSVRVTGIDEAGNESVGVETFFTLDTVKPELFIKYELGGSGTLTDISNQTISFVEKNTISVLNPNNDIASYSIYRVDEDIKSGSFTDVEKGLKAVKDDGLYTVKVYDAAGNMNYITFTFDQIYPSLPSNKYLDITSTDIEYREGIQATVTIKWEKSNDATLDHYELWINGELAEDKDDIINPVSGSTITETFTLNTIRYGNVVNYYEVRLYDDAGNYGSYYVNKHITNDLTIPTAEILYTHSVDEEIRFISDLKDPNRVIDSVYAKLYKNGEYVKKLSISTGVNEYSFSGLDSGESDYTIKIEATFDFNGSSYINEVLNIDTIYNIDTLSSHHDVKAEILSASSTDDTVNLSVELTKYDKYDESVTIGVYTESGELYKVREVELDTPELVTTLDLLFDGLSVGDRYQVRVVENDDILATYNFTTQKEIPSASFKIVDIEQHAISLGIIIKDEDSSSTSLYVILLQDGEIVPNKIQELVVGTNNITFSGLEDNREYEYKVYASYNTLNGRGSVYDDLIGSFEVFTAKKVPSIELKDIEVTGDSIVFDSDITDEDYAIKSIKAVLYKGTQSIGKELLLNEGLLRNREFNDLDPLTEYRINIEVEYDLNNSEGVVKNQLFYGVDFTTLKVLPQIEAIGITATNNEAEFIAKIIDPTESYISGFVKLYTLDSAVPIDMYSLYSGKERVFTFENLKPNTTYKIKVDADINLGGDDGDKERILYTKEFTTDPNINADITVMNETTDEISFNVNVINHIKENVVAKIFLDDEVISQYELIEGNNTIDVEGLLAGTTYDIRVEYLNGSKILLSYKITTDDIVELTKPEIFITSSDLNEDGTVLLKVDVSDIDNTLTSDRVTIRICNDQELCTIQEIGLPIIAAGLKVQLPYENNTISVSMSYDNIDHIGKITDSTDPIVRPSIEDPTTNQPKIILDETIVISIAVVLSLLIVTTALLIIYSKKSKY